jgi:hypothetical protein
MSQGFKFFTPEDFICRINDYMTRIKISDIANAKLQQLIEASPVVYGRHWYMENITRWSEQQLDNSTEKARLMFIEPIVKEECKHKSYLMRYGGHSSPTFVCVNCDKELKPTAWEVK